ncbi:MAG: hypothetical protein ABI068_04220 [Ktedonobacterales bacterium]
MSKLEEDATEAPLPEDVLTALVARGIAACDEVALRRELERHTAGYSLVRLTPAAARRWKCRYRILLAETYLDCQTAAEAYARALLAVLAAPCGAQPPAPTTSHP